MGIGKLIFFVCLFIVVSRVLRFFKNLFFRESSFPNKDSKKFKEDGVVEAEYTVVE